MENRKRNPATETTKRKNAEMYKLLDFNDKQEAEFARRGLIAAPEALEIRHADGHVIWSQKARLRHGERHADRRRYGLDRL